MLTRDTPARSDAQTRSTTAPETAPEAGQSRGAGNGADVAAAGIPSGPPNPDGNPAIWTAAATVMRAPDVWDEAVLDLERNNDGPGFAAKSAGVAASCAAACTLFNESRGLDSIDVQTLGESLESAASEMHRRISFISEYRGFPLTVVSRSAPAPGELSAWLASTRAAIVRRTGEIDGLRTIAPSGSADGGGLFEPGGATAPPAAGAESVASQAAAATASAGATRGPSAGAEPRNVGVRAPTPTSAEEGAAASGKTTEARIKEFSDLVEKIDKSAERVETAVKYLQEVRFNQDFVQRANVDAVLQAIEGARSVMKGVAYAQDKYDKAKKVLSILTTLSSNAALLSAQAYENDPSPANQEAVANQYAGLLTAFGDAIGFLPGCEAGSKILKAASGKFFVRTANHIDGGNKLPMVGGDDMRDSERELLKFR